MPLTAKLLKAGRALMEWTSFDLSEASGVPHDTIRAFESGRTKAFTVTNERAVIRALEGVGVQFIQDNSDGGDGVRFVKNKK